MRSTVVVLTLVALAMVPGALALEDVTVDAPDVRYTVEGQRVETGTSALGREGADVVLETKDQTVALDGPSCQLTPSADAAGRTASACKAEAPAAPRADVGSFVEYVIEIDLGGDALPSEAPAGPLDAQAVASARELPAQTVMLAAAAAGASFAAIYGAWRVLKWTGLAAFIPLYSHLSDNELLEDANRQAIYRLIQAEPGISTKDVADRLGLAWGTVTHHLGKLEKRRFVVSKKYGKYRRFFANGHGGTDMKDQVAVLRLDRTGDVAALIQQQPGLTQKAVSAALGVSSSTILWHVKRLESAQLITKVREGKMVRYYPGAGLGQVLVPAAPAAPVTAA